MAEVAVPESVTNAQQHRSRLLEGMAHAVAEKGYGDTTIADIVRAASVSRRTFYEHFTGKAECLVALYEAASHNALKVLRSAVDPSHGWQEQLERALGAYLGCIASNPVLLRTLFVDILGLGVEGLAARRRVHEELADYMLQVVNQRDTGHAAAQVSPALAMAVVGGIHELVLQAIEDDAVGDLQQLVGPATQLVRAVTAPA